MGKTLSETNLSSRGFSRAVIVLFMPIWRCRQATQDKSHHCHLWLFRQHNGVSSPEGERIGREAEAHTQLFEPGYLLALDKDNLCTLIFWKIKRRHA